MAGTQRFNVTLPHDIAQIVKAKVLSGEYTSVSDVICAGLFALKERDADHQSTLEGLAGFEAERIVEHEDFDNAFDAWLLGEVAPAYDKLKASPDRTSSIDTVRDYLFHKRASGRIRRLIFGGDE